MYMNVRIFPQFALRRRLCYNTFAEETFYGGISMKNAKRIGGIGQLIMVIGSILYVATLLTNETTATAIGISAVYVVALILMFIGWIGTRDERRAEKKAKKNK